MEALYHLQLLYISSATNPSDIMNKSPSTLHKLLGIGGFHWIDWSKDTMLPDPTRCFSSLVIGIMIIRFLAANDWDFSLALTGFFLNPYVLLFFGTAVAVAYSAWPTTPLPKFDRWAAEWYFWNAWLYHMVMDGASGTFRLVPVVVQQYDILDLRFPGRHVVPWVIGATELFVMGPMCLLTLWAILKRHNLRFPLELITSTLQITGMIVFVLSEVYEGQHSIPALDPVGTDTGLVFKFNLYHLVYYWFGFWFCNLVWGVFPYYRIMRAVDECQRVFNRNAPASKNKSR